MPHDAALSAFLARQQADYRASLPGRLAALHAAWHAVLAAPAAPDAWRALERCAHGVAGSAGTFGLAALGACALRLEQACEAGPGSAATAPALPALVEALSDGLLQASEPRPGTGQAA